MVRTVLGEEAPQISQSMAASGRCAFRAVCTNLRDVPLAKYSAQHTGSPSLLL